MKNRFIKFLYINERPFGVAVIVLWVILIIVIVSTEGF